MNLCTIIQTYFTDRYVFKNPEFDYRNNNINTKRIIFVEKKKNNNYIKKYIPCLFIQEYNQCSKFLIFFHGNAEDIFISELFGQLISENLNMNVIIVEYPGYSIYDEEKSAETMCEDSILIFNFIKEKFNLKDEDIYVLGRSLGTGPAIYLASKVKLNSLFLISPFKSIKSLFGIFSKLFLLDIFKSIDIIKEVNCPLKIIHGKEDPLINPSHTEELMKILESLDPINNINEKSIIENMTHNEMDIDKDIFGEINKFIKKNNLYSNAQKNYFNLKDKKFDDLFVVPTDFQIFLLKKNLELNKPIVIEKEARCSLLLNDERVAFGTDNFKILIYDLNEDDEENITIDTKDIGQINYLYQLKNQTLIGCSDYNIGFYSLKRFKFNKLNTMSFKSQIIKLEEMDNGSIILLLKDSIKIFDAKLNKKLENNCNLNNFKVVSSYIYLSSPLNKFYIYNYDENLKKLYKIKEFEYDIIEGKNSIIQLNNNFIGALCRDKCILINIENLNSITFAHNIENPSFIYKLNHNLLIIGNAFNQYEIITINFESKNKYDFPGKNKKNLNIFNMTSIICLKNGNLIITTDNSNNIIKNKINNGFLDIFI